MNEQYQWGNDPNTHSDIFPEKLVVYAGFWERFAAALIDGIILWFIGMGISLALITADMFADFLLIQYIPGIVINWLYYALQESSVNQATLGKRALNLKVTNVEGGRISLARATGRYFGKILSTIILLIGYLMMIWDDRKQTLHDKLAGTLVVKN